MSFLQDLPFEGDLSTPLGELELKRKLHVRLSYKQRDQIAPFCMSAEKIFYQVLAEGNAQERLHEEQRRFEEELNRVLLEVEKDALIKRQFAKDSIRDKKQAVFKSVDLLLEKQLENALTQPLKYFCSSQDMGHLKRIFSVVGDDRMSVTGLTSVIEPCRWLSSAIIKFVNEAGFRATFKTPEANDLKKAINLLNVEGTCLLLPELLTQYLAQSHKGYMHSQWQRFMRYQQTVNMCAYLLARKSKRTGAYKVALLASVSTFSELMFMNMLAVLGKEALTASMQIANQRQSDFRSQTIGEYLPSTDVFINLMQLANIALPKTIDAFNFSHLPAALILDVFSEAETDPKNTSDAACTAIIMRAKAFAQYRYISTVKLDNNEHVVDFLKKYRMDNSSLQFLRAQDFRAMSVYTLLGWCRRN
ncbi:hypothetical protein [Catenovulum sediminis]|uniref:HDOD domain-containing protein n=1 Tax=Catenovulum sediminis TaxID=1740262 RepID=A0ABV1RDY6_9ALTE